MLNVEGDGEGGLFTTVDLDLYREFLIMAFFLQGNSGDNFFSILNCKF